MDTFLPPIEKPKGLMMKLAYFFTRRQFGKVITPLKMHAAQLPLRSVCSIRRFPNWIRNCYCRRRLSC